MTWPSCVPVGASLVTPLVTSLFRSVLRQPRIGSPRQSPGPPKITEVLISQIAKVDEFAGLLKAVLKE